MKYPDNASDEQVHQWLRLRRSDELQKLEDACRGLIEVYASLLQRYHALDSLTREWNAFATVMSQLCELKEELEDTNRLLEQHMATQSPEHCPQPSLIQPE